MTKRKWQKIYCKDRTLRTDKYQITTRTTDDKKVNLQNIDENPIAKKWQDRIKRNDKETESQMTQKS